MATGAIKTTVAVNGGPEAIVTDSGTRDSYVILYRGTPNPAAVVAVHDSCAL
jgi:hypothetical protein